MRFDNFHTVFMGVLLIFIAFNVVPISADEYPQITDQTCDAINPCSEGSNLGCYSFPGIGRRCSELNPCSYFKCPSDTQCELTASYPAQVTCSKQCEGSDCEKIVSYDLTTGKIEIIEGNRKESKNITIRTTPGNKGILETSDTSTKFTGELFIEEYKLLMKTSIGDKPINILPGDAIKVSGTPNKAEVNEIELKEELQKPIYQIKGSKQTKLLFIIPISMKVETKVDAELGNVISTEKPWWSFLTQ